LQGRAASLELRYTGKPDGGGPREYLCFSFGKQSVPPGLPQKPRVDLADQIDRTGHQHYVICG